MAESDIDFGPIAASTPEEAASGFDGRARIITLYNARRKSLTRPLSEDAEDFTTGAIAKLEAVLRGWGRQDERDGWLTEVNQALAKATVAAKVGTTIDTPGFLRTGEYDVALRGLIMLMHRYRASLSSVYAHVLHDLLTLSGPPDPSVENISVAPGISIPETENHILMIETSRYLTNQLLADEARTRGAPLAEFDNSQNRVWMLARLQKFLRNDFDEYNARPYMKYSIPAISNLYDFTHQDDPVKVAARLVLDYLSAKFAVSSNRLRRSVPFKRRAERRNETDLLGTGADQQTARFIILSGMTQILGDRTPVLPDGVPRIPGDLHANCDGRDIMQWAAVSTYRVPRMILDIVMNASHRTYYQKFRHTGVEIYASQPEFLITAGGIWMESGHGYDEYFDYEDAGWALPSTVMPTAGGIDRSDFISIQGADEERTRINTGVAPGFACGLRPKPLISPTRTSGPWAFADCSEALQVHVAMYTSSSGSAGGNFGFFEIAPAKDRSFEDFVRAVQGQNGDRKFDAKGVNEYLTVDGRRVRFVPDTQGNKYLCPILESGTLAWSTSQLLLASGINGADGVRAALPPGISSLREFLGRLRSIVEGPDVRQWPLAFGDIMTSSRHDGLIKIVNPVYKTSVTLDMRDANQPARMVSPSDAQSAWE